MSRHSSLATSLLLDSGATRISEITEEDTVLIIGAGLTGVCCLLCTLLKNPRNIIVCEKSKDRREFIQNHYPQVMVVEPEDCEAFVKQHSLHGGADVVMEVAGGPHTFQLAWKCARPNAIVTIVAMYDKPQMLPLPRCMARTSSSRREVWMDVTVGKSLI